MEGLAVFLKQGVRRRSDRQLLLFLQFLLVLLEAGYELRYAWEVAAKEVSFPPVEALSARQRLWLQGLEELHRLNSPLVPFVRGWIQQATQDLLQSMAQHGRALPTRLNLLLIVFNLPPLFILLFGPLLLSLHWLR